MKKYLVFLITAIALMSCSQNCPDSILGKWHKHYPSINGYGELNFTVSYHLNGTYSITSECSTEKGEYSYSEASNTLKYFNRNIDNEFFFPDTIVYTAYIQGNKLYIEGYGNITEFTR